MARNGKANSLRVSTANGEIHVRKKPWRDDSMDELLEKAKEQGMSITELSNRSMISPTTLYNWRKKQTRYPQHMSLKCVARTFGMAYRLVRVNDLDD